MKTKKKIAIEATRREIATDLVIRATRAIQAELEFIRQHCSKSAFLEVLEEVQMMCEDLEVEAIYRSRKPKSTCNTEKQNSQNNKRWNNADCRSRNN